jgi:hypothetical protein
MSLGELFPDADEPVDGDEPTDADAGPDNGGGTDTGEPTDGAAERREPRRWVASVQVVPVAVVAAIAMVLPPLAYYGRIPLTLALHEAGPVTGWLAVAGAWTVGLIGTGAGIAAAATARRWGWVAVIAVVALGLGVVAVSQQADPAVSAKVYYDRNASEFGRVATFMKSRTAPTAGTDTSTDATAQGGPTDASGDAAAEFTLPADLRGCSVTGRAAMLHFSDQFFLPVTPDLAEGFFYSAAGPPTDTGSDLTELGGGWYWSASPAG